MGPWKYTIDISADHAACRRFLDREQDNIKTPGEAIDPAECGRRIAATIRSSQAYRDAAHEDDLDRIADEFEAIEPDGDTDVFDGAMRSLYDWADSWWPAGRLCWVNTHVRTEQGANHP